MTVDRVPGRKVAPGLHNVERVLLASNARGHQRRLSGLHRRCGGSEEQPGSGGKDLDQFGRSSTWIELDLLFARDRRTSESDTEKVTN
jgi:hypothetical protein